MKCETSLFTKTLDYRCILTYRIQMLRQLKKNRLILNPFFYFIDFFFFIYLIKEWFVNLLTVSIPSNIKCISLIRLLIGGISERTKLPWAHNTLFFMCLTSVNINQCISSAISYNNIHFFFRNHV